MAWRPTRRRKPAAWPPPALALSIGNATNDAVTDAWLARETAATDGPPLADRIGPDAGLSDLQRLILRAKIAARESAEQSHRVATVKGIDDDLAAATATLAAQPARYRPGTLSRLADAYADAGATEQADATRRLARQEHIFRTFSQAGAAMQQRHLDDFTGPERALAETIVRQQQDAFAADPYAAGTALYPNAGLPLPENDAEGRLRQVRMIGSLRGMPLQLPVLDNEEPSPLQPVQYDPMNQKIIDTAPEVFRGPHSFQDKLYPRVEPINGSQKVTELSRTFNSGSPTYHRYQFDDVLCDMKAPGCTAEAAYAALQRHAVPGGPKRGVPLDEGQRSPVSLGGLPGGHIKTYNEPDSRSIINVTEPDHYFAHGFVQRQIVVQGDKVLVRTYGEGNNRTMEQALQNRLLAKQAFVASTNLIKAELNPAPENGRWRDR